MTDQQRITEITARCEAATKHLAEHKAGGWEAHYSRDMSTALAEIDRLTEAQRWIPVTERLPEQSGAYWVNLRQEDKDSEEAVDFCVMAWYWPNKLLFAPQEVGWILLNEWYEFSDKMRQYITHWMPLPLPATPEKGE